MADYYLLMMAERDALRAEVERLRAERDEARQQLADLRASAARAASELRAALAEGEQPGEATIPEACDGGADPTLNHEQHPWPCGDATALRPAPVVPDIADVRERLVRVTTKHLTDAHAYLSLRHNAETLTDKILAEFAVIPPGEGDPEAVRARLYTPEGYVRQEVLDEVEAAIRRYPNMDARWWLGGVAAVGAVYRAVVRPSEKEGS